MCEGRAWIPVCLSRLLFYTLKPFHWCVEVRESHFQDKEIMASIGGKRRQCRGSAAVFSLSGSLWWVVWCVGAGPNRKICLTLWVFSLSWSWGKKCRCEKFVYHYLSLSQACGKKTWWREWWHGTICGGCVSDSVSILHVFTLSYTLLLFAFLFHCHFQ